MEANERVAGLLANFNGSQKTISDVQLKMARAAERVEAFWLLCFFLADCRFK